MARIVGCIPYPVKGERERLDEIERLIKESGADILVLPEEYFGGPMADGSLKAYHDKGWLVRELKGVAGKNSCGLVVGVIEKRTGVAFQSLWFFDEGGRYLGSESKYNLAGYEFQERDKGGLYGLAPNPLKGIEKGLYLIKGTLGTGVLCWEIFDLDIKKACDAAKPHWISDNIKFPINYFPIYDRKKGYVLTKLIKSEEGYEEWLRKLKGLAFDTLSLVIASCNANFPAYDEMLPKDAKALACIVHPDFERGNDGVIGITNKPGDFVSYELDPDEIALLREGPRKYDEVFGKGSYPKAIEATGKAWRVRHKYDRRSTVIKRE